MAWIWRIFNILHIILLPHIYVNRNDEKDAEQEGHKNPAGPFQQQLLPGPFSHGKTDPHARDKKEQGYSPYIQH